MFKFLPLIFVLLSCSTTKLGKNVYIKKNTPVGNSFKVFDLKTKKFVVENCLHVIAGISTDQNLSTEEELVKTCGADYELFNVKSSVSSFDIFVYQKQCLKVTGRCRL